jgi:hypothetical protein
VKSNPVLTSAVDPCGIMHKGNCLGEKRKVLLSLEDMWRNLARVLIVDIYLC